MNRVQRPARRVHRKSVAFGDPIGVVSTLVLVLAGLFACAGAGPSIKHEFSLAPGQAHHPGLAKALVLPLNETLDRPRGLEVADGVLMDLIRSHLGSHGLESETVASPDFQRAVRVAVERRREQMLSGASGKATQDADLSDLIPTVLSDLGSDADLVVVSNVLLRSGESTGGRLVRWDGVRRRERGTVGMSMTGSGPVASLMTLIYQRDGTRLFSGYGGLDVIFELNRTEKKFELMPDRLQDEENLAEGVCISFHPFFGDDVDC